MQLGGNTSAQQAGMLTRVHSRGREASPAVRRAEAVWGCAVTGLSIALLLPTNVLLVDYKMLAIASYTRFGAGLALYATPSTDAALSSLPEGQAGSGSGLIAFHGRADNLVALAFNVMMIVVAIVSILLTVPAGRKQTD